MTLGDRIKQRRLRQGLTQEELARRAQVPRPRIAELETNRKMTVASDVLLRLAQALSCTTDFLVGMYDESGRVPAAATLIGI